MHLSTNNMAKITLRFGCGEQHKTAGTAFASLRILRLSRTQRIVSNGILFQTVHTNNR
jgi:hypothetical protein